MLSLPCINNDLNRFYEILAHEIEAYSKDEELCRRIREIKEFNDM